MKFVNFAQIVVSELFVSNNLVSGGIPPELACGIALPSQIGCGI